MLPSSVLPWIVSTTFFVFSSSICIVIDNLLICCVCTLYALNGRSSALRLFTGFLTVWSLYWLINDKLFCSPSLIANIHHLPTSQITLPYSSYVYLDSTTPPTSPALTNVSLLTFPNLV